MNVSLIIPSRNNLKYVKTAYSSIRNYISDKVEIVLLDDASTDGTWEWMLNIQKFDINVKIYRNETSERMGHTILYDVGAELASNEIFGIFHADMIASPNYLNNLLKHLKPQTVVSGTRIEPPLHPPGPEKFVVDFGLEPEEFKYDAFLNFVKNKEITEKDKTSNGIFAPWLMRKEDFLKIGGHDKKLFAPMELEDSLHEDRILIVVRNEKIELIRFKQLFDLYEESKQVREDGKEVVDLSNLNVFSATAKPDGSIGLSKINKIIRKKTDKKLLQISTSWGETVCTEDHSLIDKDLNPIKPRDINIKTLWRPAKLGEWTDEQSLCKNNLRECFKLLLSDHLDELELLLDQVKYDVIEVDIRYICEFLGIILSDGISFDEKTEQATEYKLKLDTVFADIDFNYILNTKDGSLTKRIVDVIINLPQIYQQSFLYGYLRGITGFGICIDRESIFNQEMLELLDCKFTTKSDLLCAGISYLLRNNYPDLSVNVNFDKNEEVYNIFTNHSKQDNVINVEEYNKPSEYVYDLEMNNYGEHTFIDALGCFGVHNSDVFSRFLLSGYTLIQSRDAFVYHMTCRGSRFKDGVKIVNEIPLRDGTTWKRPQDSEEYIKLRGIKFKEWWRKWHSDVLNDENMLPIVYKRYNIDYVIHNINFEVFKFIEPWADNLYLDSNNEIIEYMRSEQNNSRFDLISKVKEKNAETISDIVVEFDARGFNRSHIDFIKKLSKIIETSGDIGEFEFDIFKIRIKSMNSYENTLIKNEDFYKTYNIT